LFQRLNCLVLLSALELFGIILVDQREKLKPMQLTEAALFISSREISHCADRLALVHLAGVAHFFAPLFQATIALSCDEDAGPTALQLSQKTASRRCLSGCIRTPVLFDPQNGQGLISAVIVNCHPFSVGIFSSIFYQNEQAYKNEFKY
jgi:hypothetical protein